MICHRCEEPNPGAAQRTSESSVRTTAEPSFLRVRGQTHPQTAAIKPSHQLRPHRCWGTAQSCIYLLKMIDFQLYFVSTLCAIPLHAIPSAVILPGQLWHTVTYRNQSKLLNTSASREERLHVQPHHLFRTFAACPASAEPERFSPFQQCDLIAGSWPALCTFIFIVWVLKL